MRKTPEEIYATITKEEIRDWISSPRNYKWLVMPDSYFNVDTLINPPEDWDSAKLKILLVFPSSAEARASSSTFDQVYYWIKNQVPHKDVFIDVCCYAHDSANHTVFLKDSVPPYFGIVSRRPVRDFDFVFPSFSITWEFLTVFNFFHTSFPRYTHEQRLEDCSAPLVMAGGAAISEASAVMGEIYSGGELLGHSLLDFAFHGAAYGVLDYFIKFSLDFQSTLAIKSHKSLFEAAILDDEKLRQYIMVVSRYRWHYDGTKLVKMEVFDDRLGKIRINKASAEHLTGSGYPHRHIAGGYSHRESKIDITYGCSGAGGVCSFCAEAQMAQVYHERPLDSVLECVDTVKRTAFPDHVRLSGFTPNYHSRICDLIYEASAKVSLVRSQSSRMDEVSGGGDSVSFLESSQDPSLTTAIEGISERSRQNFLNKNLSREAIYSAFEKFAERDYQGFKVNFIITGFETQEEWDEFLSEAEKWRDILRSKGNKIGKFMFTITPLTYRYTSPLCWEQRRSSWRMFPEWRAKGFKEDRSIYDRFNELKIRIRFSVRAKGAWITQYINDAGPLATKVLFDFTREGKCGDRFSFSERDFERVKEILSRYGQTYDFFFNGPGLDDPLPVDYLEYAKPHEIEARKEMFRKGDYFRPICLKTKATPDPKCHGCGVCSPEERKYALTRSPDANEHSVASLATLATGFFGRHHYRFLVKTSQSNAIHEKEAVARHIMIAFMEADPSLQADLYKLGDGSYFVTQKSALMPSYGSGLWVFEVSTSRPCFDRFLKVWTQIQGKVKSTELRQVYEIDPLQKIKRVSSLGALVEIEGVSPSAFLERLEKFKWVLASDSSFVKWVNINGMDKYDFRIFPSGVGSNVLVEYPKALNLVQLVCGILKKKIPEGYPLLSITGFDHSVGSDLTCDCGRPMGFSYVQNKYQKVCILCEGQSLLRKAGLL